MHNLQCSEGHFVFSNSVLFANRELRRAYKIFSELATETPRPRQSPGFNVGKVLNVERCSALTKAEEEEEEENGRAVARRQLSRIVLKNFPP